MRFFKLWWKNYWAMVEETESRFPKGAIVRLATGGPEMIVRSVTCPGGEVVCQWFAGDQLEQGTFAPQTLIGGRKPGVWDHAEDRCEV